jgi:hypothetical protein
MTSKERVEAIQQLEKLLMKITNQGGWTLEALETKDSRSEDFQAWIHLSIAGRDVEKGVL